MRTSRRHGNSRDVCVCVCVCVCVFAHSFSSFAHSYTTVRLLPCDSTTHMSHVSCSRFKVLADLTVHGSAVPRELQARTKARCAAGGAGDAHADPTDPIAVPVRLQPPSIHTLQTPRRGSSRTLLALHALFHTSHNTLCTRDVDVKSYTHTSQFRLQRTFVRVHALSRSKLRAPQTTHATPRTALTPCFTLHTLYSMHLNMARARAQSRHSHTHTHTPHSHAHTTYDTHRTPHVILAHTGGDSRSQVRLVSQPRAQRDQGGCQGRSSPRASRRSLGVVSLGQRRNDASRLFDFVQGPVRSPCIRW